MTDAAYSAKGDAYFGNRREEMLVFVPETSRTILEVGCGGAAFASYLKEQRGVRVTGIEAHPEAAEAARHRVDRVLSSSIEDALPALSGETFDCIVMNDVLEHLVDPWAVLVSLRPLLADGGVVVASIPNVRYLPVLKDFVMRGDWRYQLEGVMDKTHLRFFTRRSMYDLFEESGYVMDRIEGINSIGVSWKFGLLNGLSRGSLSDTRYQQFACVARARRTS